MGLFSSIVGIAGSLLGGGGSGKSVKQAAQLQADAARAAVAENTRQFDITRSDQMPWLKAGTSALGGIQDLLGLSGAGEQESAISALRESPLFKSLYRAGEEAVLQNASATGGLRGGNLQGGLADFGADTLTSVIERQLGHLGGLSGTGVGTAQGLGALGAGFAGNNAALMQQGAAAQAGGILGSQGIKNTNFNNLLGGISSLGSDLGVDSLLKQLGKLF